nr:winged helix-turn-helix domain-containing protein [Motilibacter peucedani]
MGATRARLLVELASPASTSELVQALGLPLGSVGGHLSRLRAAGLVEGRRDGRSVTYHRTPTGHALVAASGGVLSGT